MTEKFDFEKALEALKAGKPISGTDRGERSQPVDATHWLNRSVGVSKFNAFLGLSLRRLAARFTH